MAKVRAVRGVIGAYRPAVIDEQTTPNRTLRPLNKAELAQHLAISVRQVERLMAWGEIAFFRIGRSPRFSRAALAAFEQRQPTRWEHSRSQQAPPAGVVPSRSLSLKGESDRAFVELLPLTEMKRS
ncbi:MAG: helix-turn-helix domain-containing protein [Gaiellaceae bacterium]